MKVLCTGFKGKNNSSYYLLSKISGQKLFLTNSYDGLKKDIMNVTDKYDLVVMFGLDTSLKNTANFLCKLLIEANAGKVECAIEEAQYGIPKIVNT